MLRLYLLLLHCGTLLMSHDPSFVHAITLFPTKSYPVLQMKVHVFVNVLPMLVQTAGCTTPFCGACTAGQTLAERKSKDAFKDFQYL